MFWAVAFLSKKCVVVVFRTGLNGAHVQIALSNVCCVLLAQSLELQQKQQTRTSGLKMQVF